MTLSIFWQEITWEFCLPFHFHSQEKGPVSLSGPSELHAEGPPLKARLVGEVKNHTHKSLERLCQADWEVNGRTQFKAAVFMRSLVGPCQSRGAGNGSSFGLWECFLKNIFNKRKTNAISPLPLSLYFPIPTCNANKMQDGEWTLLQEEKYSSSCNMCIRSAWTALELYHRGKCLQKVRQAVFNHD